MSLLDLIQPPPEALINCLEAHLGSLASRSSDGLIPSCGFGQTDLLILAPRDGVTSKGLLEALSDLDVQSLSRSTAYEVLIGVVGPVGNAISRYVVSRGVSAVSVHTALAQVIGLPQGWRTSQEHLLSRPLEPLRIDGQPRIADLHAVIETSHQSAQSWLTHYFDSWSTPAFSVVYLEAEAGKGKSTLLANAVLRQLEANSGPLPFYVPLRWLQRGTGVSWPDIAASVGIVGSAAESAARALRGGLIALALDGLDEIAGRYDPTIVKGVLDAVFHELRTPRSRLILSGRKTEASLLERGTCLSIALELPDTTEQAFTEYVSIVIHSVTPTWPLLYPRVPEPPLDVPILPSGEPTQQQEGAILEWIQLVFDELGKERSLFFVQSLACLARTYQLAGNKPLVIRQPGGVQLARASLYDVCILAAALACIREQDKVEEIAKDVFTPSGQLDLLTWLAIRSAAPDSVRAQLPNPNELAKDVFRIDPVNQNEEFTAVVRQIQKHALLFASMDTSVRIGDWRPSFLSDWVRAALLCRAWRLRESMAGQIELQVILDVIASSQRTTLAFQYVFPELASSGHLADLRDLGALLCAASARGVPEACAHYWELLTGLDDSHTAALGERPRELVPLADMSDLEFEGVELGMAFSGTLVVLVGVRFINCQLRSVRLEQCDFSGAIFARCTFENSELAFSDGPIRFEGCTFRDTILRAFRSRTLPAAIFRECIFLSGCLIEQDQLTSTAAGYGEAFQFEESVAEAPSDQLLRGNCLGFDATRVAGLSPLDRNRGPDPAETCLRSLLELFFPVRAGTGEQRQARGYIRVSAIGRGSLPEGSPAARALQEILRASGFTSGGRHAHLYAPWSSVVGGGAEAISLRNEMAAFLADGTRSLRIIGLIDRIRQEGSWQ